MSSSKYSSVKELENFRARRIFRLYPAQEIPNFSLHQESLQFLLKCRWLGPCAPSWLSRPGVGPGNNPVNPTPPKDASHVRVHRSLGGATLGGVHPPCTPNRESSYCIHILLRPFLPQTTPSPPPPWNSASWGSSLHGGWKLLIETYTFKT